MQWLLNSLLMMMLYAVSSTSSAQQFENFRHIGEVSSIASGTVTSISLAPTDSQTPSQISYFDAAGLSNVFDVAVTPSQIIRDNMPVYLPATDFGSIEPSMNLNEVRFFTGSLINQSDPEGQVPAHWFRLTAYNGVWSGAFRIADQIYFIDRSRRDDIVEIRNTPSQTGSLQPTRQMKITALIDEGFVFADSPGDSIGLDSLGHIHALESLHIMEALMNDSLGITMTLDQLVYRSSSDLQTPDAWLANNSISFGIEDNFTSFIFRGDESINAQVNPAPDNSYVLMSKLNFQPLLSAHLFGNLTGIIEEDRTLQSSQNPLDAAHWSASQRSALLPTLPGLPLIQTISSDAPELEITEVEEPRNEIPLSILDGELFESIENPVTTNSPTEVSSGGGLLQSDETTGNSIVNAVESDGGGGTLNAHSLLSLLLIGFLGRRRCYNRA